MSGAFAWFTHAPADHFLLFEDDPEGEHVVVSARLDEQSRQELARRIEGGELTDESVRVYCTLPGESEQVRQLLDDGGGHEITATRGTVCFLATAGSPDGVEWDAGEPVSVHVVAGLSGMGPRCYRFSGQCATCGELHGRVLPLPSGGVMLGLAQNLSCRCQGITCRYCRTGRVRRPLTEHCDPERRAGATAWYGYLIPCGACQTAGCGPDVILSKKARPSRASAAGAQDLVHERRHLGRRGVDQMPT
jgi:hypothetical protein